LANSIDISGVPGIGKTISVLEVINQLRKSNSKKVFLFSNSLIRIRRTLTSSISMDLTW